MHLMAHDPVAVLKAAIEKKGWTQTELARVSGVHQSLISRYLAGEDEVGPKNANRLARALGLEMLSILGKQYAA
jgi:transcriptional regulator with XRE-family HTH domain